jgi:hypothetical protein
VCVSCVCRALELNDASHRDRLVRR